MLDVETLILSLKERLISKFGKRVDKIVYFELFNPITRNRTGMSLESYEPAIKMFRDKLDLPNCVLKIFIRIDKRSEYIVTLQLRNRYTMQLEYRYSLNIFSKEDASKKDTKIKMSYNLN